MRTLARNIGSERTFAKRNFDAAHYQSVSGSKMAECAHTHMVTALKEYARCTKRVAGSSSDELPATYLYSGMEVYHSILVMRTYDA